MSTRNKSFVIGLVGGIAAGKSTYARLLQQHGAVVIDADEVGHEILIRPLTIRRLVQLFGSGILASDGSILRSELAKLVFGDDADSVRRLEELEKVTHPQIHAEAVKRLMRLNESASPPAVVVLDAPLLLEAGWARMCDLILFIDTPRDVRRQRAVDRGWSEKQFRDREAAQMPLDEKRQAATHILSGTSDPMQQAADIERLLAELMPDNA